MNGHAAGGELGPEVARAVARALGIAWVGVTLYEDPLSEEAFTKAASRIAALAPQIPPIMVSARTLRLGSRDLADEGLSIRPLAQACFLHGIGVLRFTPDLTARALATFLGVVRLPPDAVAHEGGFARVAKRRLVVGVEVYAHEGALDEPGELTTWDDRWSWSAESLAAVLRSVEPSSLAETLLEGFRGAVAVEAVQERQAAVTAHVEALMTLRPSVQAGFVDQLFDGDPALAELVFGHLASHELARLSEALGPAAHGRAAELLAARGDDRGHLDVAERRAGLPSGASGASVPPVEQWWGELLTVMQLLLASDLEADERAGLVEAWGHAFDALVRGGRFLVADAWLDLPLKVGDPEFKARLMARRQRIPGREACASLADSTDDVGAVGLLIRLLEVTPTHLLALLGGLDDASVAAVAARCGPTIGEGAVGLVDLQPSSQRSLEVALRIAAASGVPLGSDPRVLAHLSDPDPAVASAALAAAGPGIDPERLAPLLLHADAGVRAATVDAFRSCSGSALRVLADALLVPDLDLDTAEAVGGVLIGMPGGVAAVGRVAANVQLLVSAKGRSLRRRLQAIAREAG